MQAIKEKDFQGICPGTSGDTGYFSWVRREGETEEVDGRTLQIDAFHEVFIVVSRGTVATRDNGQFSSTAPIKYCKTAEEAIALVNQLNATLGTKDLSLPYARCVHCESDNLEQSSLLWQKGTISFHCLDCGQVF
jgi:hypothetical protein